jgi:hypothetical protein
MERYDGGDYTIFFQKVYLTKSPSKVADEGIDDISLS